MDLTPPAANSEKQKNSLQLKMIAVLTGAGGLGDVIAADIVIHLARKVMR